MMLWPQLLRGRSAAVLASVAAFACAAPAAKAAFPGRNGEIAFAAQSDYFCSGIGPGLSAAVYVFTPGPSLASVDLGRPLLREAGDPDWSPSGRRIAAARYTPIYGHSGMGYNTPGIFTATAAGGGRVTVNRGGQSPAWSPDASRIAFAASDAGLRTVRARGGGARVLDRHSVLDVNWSPRGKIAYTRLGRRYAIYTIDPNGRHRRFVAYGEEPDWSPDGRMLAFRDERGEIAVIRADGRGIRVVIPGTRNFNPRWSPDGTQIAYTVNSDSTDGDVFVVGADGTGARQVAQLTADPCGDESLVTALDWRPLGR